MADEVGVNRLNKFGIGIAVMAVAVVALIWYTNPELITFWLKKEELKGKIVWQPDAMPKVIVYNESDVEWRDVKVTLNKNSVSQRYEFTVQSLKRHPLGFHIPVDKFKKSNGEAYDVNAGAPHLITVRATVEKKLEGDQTKDVEGQLEVKLGDRKLQ